MAVWFDHGVIARGLQIHTHSKHCHVDLFVSIHFFSHWVLIVQLLSCGWSTNVFVLRNKFPYLKRLGTTLLEGGLVLQSAISFFKSYKGCKEKEKQFEIVRTDICPRGEFRNTKFVPTYSFI